MKNKALTTIMATAITATLVLPMPTTSATSSDLSVSRSHYTESQAAKRVAATIPSGEQSITISNVAGDTVRTSIGQLTFNDSLTSIFNTGNRQALTNAKATVFVEDGEITDITALTLNKPGTSKKPVVFDGGSAQISGSVTVAADYITLQNVAIGNDLIVNSRVRKAVTIDSVKVGDTITFQPLRTRKINWLDVSLKNVKAPDIDVKRNKLKLNSNQSITSIHVTDKVPSLEVNADVEKIIVEVKSDFSLQGEGKINQAIVKRGSNVSLDSSHEINNVQIDDKSANVTYAADKTALNKLVSSLPYVSISVHGNDVLTTEKWTTQAVRSTFDAAVNSAKAVVNDKKASKTQVDTAIAQLSSAIATYQAAQKHGTKYTNDGTKSTLSSLINSVQYVTVSWNNGHELLSNVAWTTQGEKDALSSAVSSAQNVVNNYYASTNEITNAINNLNNAITNYKNAYKYGINYGHTGDRSTLSSLISSVYSIYVTESWDGYNLPYNTVWTTPSEKSALTSAVSSAQNVLNNHYASQYEITNEINNLNNAITNYKNAYKYGTNGYGYYGDKSTLQSLINDIQYAAVSYSNGSDVPYSKTWTTYDAKAAIDSAVSQAQAVVNNYYAAQHEISNAINNLKSAISSYYQAKNNNYYY